jgi:hypothetical protein
MEAESEAGGGNCGGGTPLMMLTDSDKYCDRTESKKTEIGRINLLNVIILPCLYGKKRDVQDNSERKPIALQKLTTSRR